MGKGGDAQVYREKMITIPVQNKLERYTFYNSSLNERITVKKGRTCSLFWPGCSGLVEKKGDGSIIKKMSSKSQPTCLEVTVEKRVALNTKPGKLFWSIGNQCSSKIKQIGKIPTGILTAGWEVLTSVSDACIPHFAFFQTEDELIQKLLEKKNLYPHQVPAVPYPVPLSLAIITLVLTTLKKNPQKPNNTPPNDNSKQLLELVCLHAIASLHQKLSATSKVMFKSSLALIYLWLQIILQKQTIKPMSPCLFLLLHFICLQVQGQISNKNETFHFGPGLDVECFSSQERLPKGQEQGKTEITEKKKNNQPQHILKS